MTSLTPPTSAARRYVRVLSIAGSDSGGGAGIQADLKTFSALGCYGMTAITAITAQNTCGVTGIHGIPPEMLKAQIDAVVQDIGVDAVKIGMLHSPEVVRVVADAIRTYQLPHVVLDPVMVATSGDRLIASETVSVLVQELFPLAEVITPNLDEAGWLLGRSLQDADAPQAAIDKASTQLGNVQGSLAKTQEQLSTGKQITKPSDEPDKASLVTRLESEIARQKSYQESIKAIEIRRKAEETALNSTSDVMFRMKELSVQAANDTLGAADRKTIALEMTELRNQILSLANSQDSNGNYLFAGSRVSQMPFSPDAKIIG